MGKTIEDFTCEFDPSIFPQVENIDSIREIAMSYAAFRILDYRYRQYGSKGRTIDFLDALALELGLQTNLTSTDYTSGSAIALGNYIGECVINFGLQDGSHEDDLYESRSYVPVNPPLRPDLPGNPAMINPNRWQPISVFEYIEQKGWDKTLDDWNYLLLQGTREFLTPEWGNVIPFALSENDKKVLMRDGIKCNVYCDPGPPPSLNTKENAESSEHYKWGFLLNILWSSQLDPKDSVKIDISPGAIGNVISLPKNFAEYPENYNLKDGGYKAQGHKINPFTKEPYKPNMVYRADYARVIAEYWVDGPNTFSPPGHWIYNLTHTSYHKDFKRQWKGKGKVMSALEWDVKAYFTMAGTFHDASIAAFSVKGYYDFVRPISAIRYMAGLGQCSDPDLPNYHIDGIPLMEGFIELVGKKDPLVGDNKENLNKIKVYTWKGPDAIEDVYTETAGVGWILAENWWPYQRYTFITPSFAGYVSGHSTYSSAGASVLERITGDSFFPGGMAEFTAKKNEFLQFEEGPSEDVTLQWGTYWDAAYQTCLSRLWGGIHPPCDDIPGRIMGIYIGENAVKTADQYFKGKRD
ncbi:MAG: vanadium-dependent haloperoxidase [Bacteroidales bacterium]